MSRALARRVSLLAGSALAALALSGCGGDSGGEELSGPATVMPADSPFYIEATIRPEGEQAEDLDALLSSLGELPVIGEVGDPGEFLIEQLESQAAAAGVDFSYADDVEPWLGERIGGVGSAGEDASSEVFAFAVETTDEEAARDSLERLLSDNGVPFEEGEYEGVTYIASPGDEFRLGAFGGHVVFASQAEFEAAVDASQGESLAESDKLADALASREEGSLATFFLDLEQAEEFGDTPEDAAEIEQAKAVAPEFFDDGLTISAGVSASDEVYVDYVVPMFAAQPEAGETELLAAAPGDSLGALALSEAGDFGPPILELFERAQAEGADLEDYPEEGLAEAFENETGVPFDDAADAIGDASFHVRGELPAELEVGGEIKVTDTEVATKLIEAAEAKIREEGEAKLGPPVGGSDVGFSALEKESHEDLPFANVELEGETIRYGFFRDEDAAKASDPQSAGEFGDTETFATGREALGEDFEYIGAADLAPILDEFVEGPSIPDVALGGGSPEDLIGPLVAGKLGVVAFGQRYEDDLAISRYVLKLKE